MPTLDMSGPYPFNSIGIDENVPEGTIGNYAIGQTNDENTFIVHYVGRSLDVRKRLHEHLNDPTEDWSKVHQFKFSKAEDEVEAYKKECLNWHDFGEDIKLVQNENHPAKPKGRTDLKCPRCQQ